MFNGVLQFADKFLFFRLAEARFPLEGVDVGNFWAGLIIGEEKEVGLDFKGRGYLLDKVDRGES
jgi:hypothetical protein